MNRARPRLCSLLSFRNTVFFEAGVYDAAQYPTQRIFVCGLELGSVEVYL